MFFEWPENQPVTLTCTDKFFETPESVSIRLAPRDQQALFQFKPGQFVNLGVEIDGQRLFRAYSISSLPKLGYLQLTIKRAHHGQVSNFIIDSLAVGDHVQLLPPTGDFNCIDHPPKVQHTSTKALLISAGCGITPVFAMAQYWLTHQPNVDIAFLHVAHSPQATIYLEQLQAYDTNYAQFHLHLLLSDQGQTSYPQGRLDSDKLIGFVPDLHQRTVYLCGPSQFMRDVQSDLDEFSFDMTQFHHESFTPSDTFKLPETDTLPQNDQTEVSITLPAYQQTLTTQSGQLLADVLEEAGLPIIIACRSGICGSCKCKVHHGEVISSSQAPLTSEEIEQGYVLACSSTIVSDLDLKIG